MGNNNSSTTDNKINPHITNLSLLNSIIPNKSTSLRPNRSVIPSKSIYRTGIKAFDPSTIKESSIIKK